MSNPLHTPMIDMFHKWYLSEKGVKYRFTGAQCKAIDAIYEHIVSAYGTKPYTNDGILNTWQYLLANMKSTYEWLYLNCDLTVINSKFNILIDKAKNQKQSQSAASYTDAKMSILKKIADYEKRQ